MGRVAKRQLRNLKEQGIDYELQPSITEKSVKTSLNLKTFNPLTDNQERTFDYYEEGSNILLHGLAGTGKTFTSMYLALRDVLVEHTSKAKKIFIVRSVVPTRDIGFLPGTTQEKVQAYEAPYKAICSELFGRDDAYEILKKKGVIEFITTSFIRGVTLNNGIIIADEINNMNFHELDSVITRIGKNCRVLMCGDFRQSDLPKESERQGLITFMRILERMGSFNYVEFEEEDIVRSGLVKEYIIVKDRLGVQA